MESIPPPSKPPTTAAVQYANPEPRTPNPEPPQPVTSHDRVVLEVEQMLVEAAAADRFTDSATEKLVQIWRDAAGRLEVGRTQKPAVWAAAVRYAFARIRFGDLTQAEAAQRFGVSVQSVTAKFGQIDCALELLTYDPRYLAEGEDRPAVFGQLDALMARLQGGGLSLEGLDPLLVQNILGGGLFGAAPDPAQDKAQDLVYDGWDAMGRGDDRAARRLFDEALALDPEQPDALNGLAGLEDDARASEALYRRALEAARARLGADEPGAFMWWGEIETRPYMRARHGLGLVLTDLGRHAQAVAEYRALLERNPEDNQGIRYLLAPTLLESGDLEGALRAYADYDRDYPDDAGEPDHAVLRGLALWLGGRHQDAVRAWFDALAVNLYVVPAVLGEPLPPADLWHGSSYQWPDLAEHHVEVWGDLWDRSPDATEALGRFWHAPEVQAHVARAVEVGQEMKALSDARRAGDAPGDRWRALVAERWERAHGLPDAAARRIAGG